MDVPVQHWAVTKGNVEIMQYLISAGIKVNLTNEEDQTALMRACRLGKSDAVRCLIAAKVRSVLDLEARAIYPPWMTE